MDVRNPIQPDRVDSIVYPSGLPPTFRRRLMKLASFSVVELPGPTSEIHPLPSHLSNSGSSACAGFMRRSFRPAYSNLGVAECPGSPGKRPWNVVGIGLGRFWEGRNFGCVHLKNGNGVVLTIPSIEASLPLIPALIDHKVAVRSLLAKGWTLVDLTQSPELVKSLDLAPPPAADPKAVPTDERAAEARRASQADH